MRCQGPDGGDQAAGAGVAASVVVVGAAAYPASAA